MVLVDHLDEFTFWGLEAYLLGSVVDSIVIALDDSLLVGEVHNLGQFVLHITFSDVISVDGFDVFSTGEGQLLGSISPGTTSKSGMGKALGSGLVFNGDLINSVSSLAANLLHVATVEAILGALRILDETSWAVEALSGLCQELCTRASVGPAAFVGFGSELSDEAIDLAVLVVGTVVLNSPDPA